MKSNILILPYSSFNYKLAATIFNNNMNEMALISHTIHISRPLGLTNKKKNTRFD